MTDVDQWIEIAKDCKYLPENDLKVIFNSEIENITRPTVIFISLPNLLIILLISEIMWYGMRFFAWRV